MATKKTKNAKSDKAEKDMPKTKKTPKTQEQEKAPKREIAVIKPYEGPITIVPNDRAEARAEAVEALEGLTPEARAGAVEALDTDAPRLYEVEHAGEAVRVTVPEGDEPDPTMDNPEPDPEGDWEGGAICALGPTGQIIEARPAPSEPAPEPTLDDRPPLIAALQFARTGKPIEEIRPSVIIAAAEAWRDAKTERDRSEAADVLARAGWFRSPEAPAPAPLPKGEPPAPAPHADTPDLAALRVEVEEAKAQFEAAEAAAEKVEENARAVVAQAKERYRAALAPYRDACKLQGRECEYEGGRRGANVSDRVTFEVALEGENVRIALRDRPETEERVPVAEVRAGVSKVAYRYADRYIGPRDVVGNKGGTLSNKLRAVVGR